MIFPPTELYFIIVYGLVFISGTVGNCFIIKWFGVREEREKPGNKLVVALAVNHFLASIFLPLYQIYYIVSEALSPWYAWSLGRD